MDMAEMKVDLEALMKGIPGLKEAVEARVAAVLVKETAKLEKRADRLHTEATRLYTDLMAWRIDLDKDATPKPKKAAPVAPSVIDPVALRIRLRVVLSKPLTFGEIAKVIPCSTADLTPILAELIKEGKVVKTGSRRACRYSLAQEAAGDAMSDSAETVHTARWKRICTSCGRDIGQKDGELTSTSEYSDSQGRCFECHKANRTAESAAK